MMLNKLNRECFMLATLFLREVGGTGDKQHIPIFLREKDERWSRG